MKLLLGKWIRSDKLEIINEFLTHESINTYQF